MSRYLTPLPGLFATAVEQAINRAIGLDEGAAPRLQPLSGKLVRLELKGPGIDLFFHATGDRLKVTAESTRTPDTTISGSPAALLAMAVPDWFAAGTGVRIEGDAGSAQALEKLLRRLDPDWETIFVERFGPVVGHQLWRMLADARNDTRRVAETTADQVARYLREESGMLVTREEMTGFVEEVDELREAVDRLEARIRRRA